MSSLKDKKSKERGSYCQESVFFSLLSTPNFKHLRLYAIFTVWDYFDHKLEFVVHLIRKLSGTNMFDVGDGTALTRGAELYKVITFSWIHVATCLNWNELESIKVVHCTATKRGRCGTNLFRFPNWQKWGIITWLRVDKVFDIHYLETNVKISS